MVDEQSLSLAFLQHRSHVLDSHHLVEVEAADEVGGIESALHFGRSLVVAQHLIAARHPPKEVWEGIGEADSHIVLSQLSEI